MSILKTVNDSFLIRAGRFVLKHVFKNRRYMIAYGLAYFQKDYHIPVSFYSGQEILALIQAGKSIVRYGDGEVALMNFRSLAFQRFDPTLREGLFRSMKGSASDAYIVGINERAFVSNEIMRNNKTLQLLLPQKVYVDMYFQKNKKYMDASFFYRNENVNAYLLPALEGREIIFVTRKETIESIKQNPKYPYLPFTHFIETKERDAFDDYEVICKQVGDVISQLKENNRKPLVIAAFGAGTKVFAYEYGMKGVQVLDIGTGIEILYQDKRIDGIL
ncbi:MAG: hypothetical protein RI935_775 [Candidatus Parcubacteria bacterium]|jgi:hypothetical protein